MKEKKSVKICLYNALLVIALIVIVIMGRYIVSFKINNESLNSEGEGSKTSLSNMQESLKSINIDFSELMDKIYFPKAYKEASVQYNNTIINETAFYTVTDVSNKITEASYYDIYAMQGEKDINIRVCNILESKDDYYSIKGVAGEVVSIKFIRAEDTSIPTEIYMLTRDGFVYYVQNTDEQLKDCTAKKIEGLEEVIAINIVDVIEEDAMHSYNNVVVSTCDKYYIINDGIQKLIGI